MFGDNYSVGYVFELTLLKLIGILMSEVLCGSVGKLHTSAQEVC